MRVTGNTPDRIKKIYIQGSQQFSTQFSTFHFDDSQGPPKDGIWFHVQGSYVDGDAAASSVARETAVSFSPAPQRAPPRPSNVTRKRKERLADLGDDDDDFVGVPPRPSASPSKVNRVAVRKDKNSKSSHDGPKHSEGVQNPSKRKNTFWLATISTHGVQPRKMLRNNSITFFKVPSGAGDAVQWSIPELPFSPTALGT